MGMSAIWRVIRDAEVFRDIKKHQFGRKSTIYIDVDIGQRLDLRVYGEVDQQFRVFEDSH